MIINNLELATPLDQIPPPPRMAPLADIRTAVDNTAAQGLANRDIIKSSSTVGSILHNLAFLTHHRNIYSTMPWLKDTNNKMAGAVY